MGVKERQILFSAPMVRAILAGRKTQTRRVVKPQPDWERPMPCSSQTPEGWQGPLDYSLWSHEGDASEGSRRCPYGQPGDRLWVREAWRVRGGQEYEYQRDRSQVMYRATHGEDGYPLGWESYDWRPSIHMPRWASRITLEITGVRVERLNEVSEADAMSEGVTALDGQFSGCYAAGPALSGTTAKECFRRLWASINGPDSWEANPWVWVLEFRRIDA